MGQSPLTGPAQGKTWVYSPACTFLLPERGKKLPAASTHPAACPQGTRVSLLPCPGTLAPGTSLCLRLSQLWAEATCPVWAIITRAHSSGVTGASRSGGRR